MRVSENQAAASRDPLAPLLAAGEPRPPEDPFPPAKSDEEIADMVSQMGAELGAFDTQARGRASAGPRAPTRRRRRRARVGPPHETTTRHRARVPATPAAAPPPVPVWAWPSTTSDGD